MKTTKITPIGKFVIFIFIVGIVLGGIFMFGGKDLFTKGNKLEDTPKAGYTSKDKEDQSTDTDATKDETKSENNEINIALSEKITWKPIVDANGGLTTQPGSIYDKLGIKVNITLDNKPASSSQNFIDNNVNALGYTVNGYSAFYKQFQDASVETVMPYLTSYSAGTDGVLARGDINTVEDFIGKKIGVPDSSSNQTLVLWLMLKSDLNQEQINKIKKNIVVYKSVKEASEAFFKGEVDVVGTRQPYLTQAKSTENTKVLFSTKSASNLIVDGIIFRKDFADANEDVVSKFIDGALLSINTTDFSGLKNFETFKDTTDEEFKQMMTEIKYADYTANYKYLDGLAQKLFDDMSIVWEMAGKEVIYDAGNKVLSNQYILGLADSHKLGQSASTVVSEATKQKAVSQDNGDALIKKSTSINFKANSAKFENESAAHEALNEFVNIANFLDGAIIQIEGNIADTGSGDTKAGKQLSLQRAKTVANYLQSQGIDPSRFVVIGNGTSKQIADNKTEEGMKQNRRTDIFFKVIE